MAGQDFYTDPAQEAVHPEARLPQRPGKRRMRWTDQHTKILILGIVLAALLVGTIIYAIAKQKKPDYTLGLITSYSMPETGVMQIEDLLGRFADDRNGDGTVRVEVVNYVFSDSETLQGLQKASQQALEQDLAKGTSLLFLHDQEGFQKVAGEFAGLLQDREGNPLGEEAAELEAAAVPWDEVARPGGAGAPGRGERRLVGGGLRREVSRPAAVCAQRRRALHPGGPGLLRGLPGPLGASGTKRTPGD